MKIADIGIVIYVCHVQKKIVWRFRDRAKKCATHRAPVQHFHIKIVEK